MQSYYALSGLNAGLAFYQGRRASLRFALATGFHIPRLWRCLNSELQLRSTK